MVRRRMLRQGEQRFLRGAMTGAEPEPGSVEEVKDLPEVPEDMIPPETESPVPCAVITASEEVLEFTEETEPEAEENEVSRSLNAVDYSGERIPVPAPVCGGVACSPHELVYDRGDGTVRRIPDPLGVLTEEGLYPFFPEVRNPSANVPAAE